MKTTKVKLRKAYKARVEIPPETVTKLWKISRVMCHLWNMAILQAEQWLKNKEKPISAYSFNYWLTDMRKLAVMLKSGERIELDSVSSDCQREVLRKLAGSYTSYFELRKNGDKEARMPSMRAEEWFTTLSWSTCRIHDRKIHLLGMNETMVFEISDYLHTCIKAKDVVHTTIRRHWDHKLRKEFFELSLVTAAPLPKVKENPKFFRAVDLGAGDIAVTDSDGSEFLIPVRRPDKHWRDIVGAIESRTKKRDKKSRGWKRLMGARRRIWNRCADQHISYQRKLAEALTEEKVDCLIIGKSKNRLGLSQSESGTADEHWGVQNTGYMFRTLLYIKEKAEECGIKVIEVSDPPRQGDSADPETKFAATRQMLSRVLGKEFPTTAMTFRRKKFRFVQ